VNCEANHREPYQDDKQTKSRANGPGFARIARDPFEEGGWMVRPSSYQL